MSRNPLLQTQPGCSQLENRQNMSVVRGHYVFEDSFISPSMRQSQMETFWYQRRSLAAQLLAWGLGPCCSPCPHGQHGSKAPGWELDPVGLREACTVSAASSFSSLPGVLLPVGSSASVTAAIEGWHRAANSCGNRHSLGPLNTSLVGIIGYYERLLGSQWEEGQKQEEKDS